MRLWLRTALCVIVILMTFNVSYSAGQFFMMENPLIGEKAPDFTLEAISGQKLNMTKYRDNQAAIIFFWATWCPHCREQLEVLGKEGPAIAKKNIKIILVDIGESPKQVKTHLERERVNFEVFLDRDQNTAEAYAIIGVPTFFFVNKKGVIKAVEHTIPDNYEKILE